MTLPYDRTLKPFARALRASMTDAERKLWSAVRGKQVHGRMFARQKTIGRYIVDFHCASAGLVVEIDGGQHSTDEGIARDRERDSALAAMGQRVLRFSDRDVLTNIEGVLETVWKACDKTNAASPLSERTTTASPLSERGAGGVEARARNPLDPPLPKGEGRRNPLDPPLPKGEGRRNPLAPPKGEEERLP